MLLYRIITILILVPIVICVVLFAHLFLFKTVLAVFLGLGIFEWAGLIGIKKPRYRIAYLVVLLVVMFLFSYLPAKPILWLGLIFWLSPLYFFCRYQDWFKCWGSSIWMRAITGFFVFLPCWVGVLYLHQDVKLVLFVLILIWFTDSGAYIAGKKFGKHKLMPQISPGKTWEGLAGGLIVAIIVTVIWVLYFQKPMFRWPAFILLSILAAMFSVVSDLFESMVKRFSGVKDSGDILPGHGGMLDRIDSMLAAMPLFAIGASIFLF